MGDARGIRFSHEESNSSNYRELSNLFETLEEGLHSGQLTTTEVWIFTDNSTAESMFWKGHSSSPRLNDLTL
jgi:hypothetical protein